MSGATLDPLRLLKIWTQRVLTPSRIRPVIGDHPFGGPTDSTHTFVVVCSVGFNVTVPNAAATFRLGLARGFAAAGVQYRLVGVFDLASALSDVQRPFVLLSLYDYLYMDRRARRALARVPHFVWVNPSFPGLADLYARHALEDPRAPAWLARRVLDSAPAFVFAIAPPSCLKFYEDWARAGMRVESVPLACDDTRYTPGPVDPKFEHVKIAYVGGYWKYKNVQYEKYLRPYEAILAVYGYDQWPYSGYSGRLSDQEETLLYRSATVCPALSEPHAEVMGDIVERVYKVLGCGGLPITDVVPFYSELFASDELLVPTSLAEYHDMVRRALDDHAFRARYRLNGYRAVEGRHLYVHRARQILDLLGIDARPADASAVTASARINGQIPGGESEGRPH